MKTPTNTLYLSVNQVAMRFGVSKDSTWRWRRRDKFPAPVKLDGRTTRGRLSDIEDYENQCVCEFAVCLKFEPEVTCR